MNMQVVDNNLSNNTCICCGLVPLKECDPQFGMCPTCLRGVVLKQDEVDLIYFKIRKHNEK